MRIGRVELGQRSETVRRSNLAAITRCLHELGPQSRSELVAATGLTRSAIRALVGELAAAGLAAETAAVPLGTPGRPSPVVRLVPDGAVVLGIEILVDSIAAAIVGLGGEVLEQVRVDRARTHLGAEKVARDLVELTAPMRSRAGSSVVGVGVAVAGVVRHADGLVEVAPNLGWRDEPLGARLQHLLDLGVPVAVANDADLGILAEHRRGAAIGSTMRCSSPARSASAAACSPVASSSAAPPATGARSGTCRSTPAARRAAAARSAAGRPSSARERSSRSPGCRPTPASPAWMRCSVMPPPGTRRRSSPSSTWAAGWASASPPSSTCSTPGSSCSAACTAGSCPRCGRSSRPR